MSTEPLANGKSLTRTQMPVEVRDTSEFGWTDMTQMRLRDGGFVSTMRAHSGDISRLGELDHLAVQLDEVGGGLGGCPSRGLAFGHGGPRNARQEHPLAGRTRMVKEEGKGHTLLVAHLNFASRA